MLRVILGLLKGGIVGVGIGVLANKFGVVGGVTAYVAYGVVGGLVGIVGGKPLWRQETLWTPLLKGIVGFLIGMGLFWAAGKLFGAVKLPLAAGFGALDAPVVEVPYLLAPIIGIVYGVFVEVDDGASAARADAKSAVAKPKN